MKGYLPHRIVKAIVFWVLTLCILSSTLASILLAWDGVDHETASRLIASALALAAGSIIFLVVNLAFGSLFQEFGSTRDAPSLDPAFGERLKRAKEEGRAETSPMA